MLLVDTFEKVRNRYLENYDSCPSHYLGAPDLSWDTTFSITKVEVDLISEVETCLLLEKGIRGGVYYVLEVDLEYRKKSRELHNVYSLGLDKLEHEWKMLSDYQLKIADDCNIFIGNVKKLVPIFCNKEKFVLHYKNLQLYLRLRLKIKKVHYYVY